jgi:outer membrane protein assembly factor BamD
MWRRIPVIVLLGVLAFTVACTNKKVNNPLANVGSKQPDKVLFDRAMDALKHNRYDVGRLTLETLINTYPDSEYIARAKLAVADSWYAEGGAAALQQAEVQYKDFITFFPTMPEAAEAQLRIGDIHYQQMEKPDRDYTHALRAEEEYRNLILQFPDSKLVPKAKQRLMEVQEVLAEREYRVGRFYYLRGAFPASIARLQSVVDEYPLYSNADEALYLLAQSYEGEINLVRAAPKIEETKKANLLKHYSDGAAEAYSRILTRYPLMDRAPDAKQRLEEMHRPVPRATREAIAQNKAEEDSRRQAGMVARVMENFRKHPDVSQAARVGEPTLVDPQMMSATEVVQQASQALRTSGGGGKDSHSLSVETVGNGQPGESQAPPRSDAPTDTGASDVSAGAASTTGAETTGGETAAPAQPDPNELKPNAPATPDPNELKPNVSDGTQPAPPPPQVNEIQNGGNQQSTSGTSGQPQSGQAAAADKDQQSQDDSSMATSKKKKKKGLKKIIPF